MATETKKKKEDKKKKGGKQSRPRNRRKRRKRRGRRRQKSEYQHTVVDIRRVTRVVAGGRRFNFSVVVVAGNRKGSVGVGIGKAGDIALAIDKAVRNAKKNMVTLSLTDEGSIAHEVEAKYGSAVIKVFPTPGKTGITAGSAVRTVLEYAGVQGVSAKIFSRSKNKLNNARATLKALKPFVIS